MFSLKNRFFEIYYKYLKLKMDQTTLKDLQIKKSLSCKLHTWFLITFYLLDLQIKWDLKYSLITFFNKL